MYSLFLLHKVGQKFAALNNLLIRKGHNRRISPPQETDYSIRVVLPFKDQISADIVRKQLKDLSLKVHTTIQPVFVSRKIEQELNVKETKPPIVNQQCVIYSFQCDLCDAGYLGYTRGHLHNRVKGHKQQSSAISKHYKNVHGTILQDPLKRFKPNLNVQSDSIRAKYFYNLFIIFAPFYVNSSLQNRFKCCNLHDHIYIFLDNGVMTIPKRRILSFVFTVLCFKKSLLIFLLSVLK